ncbi:MAG: HNH endonuclease [Bacteroidales bacterium]|nr:HNH endonuclease [Bacteroidales bacterium]
MHRDTIEERRAELTNNQRIEEERTEKEAIKQQMLNKERKKRLHKEALNELIEAGELFNSFTNKDGRREPIPQEVMDKVWNRDGGRCVKCGSQENLEFDHIIPVSKGGATTYRNIQLLCKKCNLEKTNKIG